MPRLGGVFGRRVSRGAGMGSKSAFGMLMGGAAIAGGISAAVDPNNGFGDLQEATFGDRDAVRYAARAAVINSFTDDPMKDSLSQPLYSYYGTPYNSRAAMSNRGNRFAPVDGSVVFGAYNLRRGGN